MGLVMLARETENLAQQLTDLAPPEDSSMLTRWRQDSALLMSDAGLTPDPWQSRLLRSSSTRLLLLCSRQSGKSTTAAALALRTALLHPDALVLLVSRALRQSGELFRKVLRLYRALGEPVAKVRETALTVELANDSRIVAIPGDGDNIVGYSGVGMLIIDEAARVPDELYFMTRPMLAVSRGTLVALSTPFGKQGWFHEAWTGPDTWERCLIRADQCPRITPDFLAEERRALGPRWYCQEYECSFEDCVGAVFTEASIAGMLDSTCTPLFK
jgi:hypothetical protein